MELQLLGPAILTESARSKEFLFFLSRGMLAVTSRFGLSPPKGQPIFTMFCGMTQLRSAPELEI
jgi:hypothetical protein